MDNEIFFLTCLSGFPSVCIYVYMLTIVFDVVCLLAGVVCRDAVDLHSHQRVDDGLVFVLVDFR